MIIEKYYNEDDVIFHDKRLYIRNNFCLSFSEMYFVKWDIGIIQFELTRNTEKYLNKIYENVQKTNLHSTTL